MARIEHYDIGDLWTPLLTWKVDADRDGVPETATDPTQIVVRLQTPAGVESVVTTASSPSTLTSASTPLARMSQGVFQLNPGVSLDAAGYWFVRAEGTGAAQASEEFQAIVDPSEFTSNAGVGTRALVGLQETKDWLNRQNIDTGEDLELVRVINDVSDRIHYEAGREFVAKDSGTSRTFEIPSCGYVVYVGDMAVLSTASSTVTVSTREGVAIKTVDSTYITTYPLNREAWEPIRKIELNQTVAPVLYPGMRVTVNGTWGFPAIPGNIRQAALDSVAAILDRDVEHYREDITAEQQSGNTIVLSSPQQMFIALPPAAFAVVRSYRDPALG